MFKSLSRKFCLLRENMEKYGIDRQPIDAKVIQRRKDAIWMLDN
jgi:hypothetical protein